MKAFSKAPGNRIGEYTLDANDSAIINLEFANGALGCIHTSRWVGGHMNRLFLKIAGTKGTVEIDSDRSTTGYRATGFVVGGTWTPANGNPSRSNPRRTITSAL